MSCSTQHVRNDYLSAQPVVPGGDTSGKVVGRQRLGRRGIPPTGS